MDSIIENEYDFVTVQTVIGSLEAANKQSKMALSEGIAYQVGSTDEMLAPNVKIVSNVINYLKANVNAYKPGTYQNVNSGRSSETTRR